MPITYKISLENVAEIKKIRKTISYQKVDRRLYAVQLRGEGMTNHEIAEKLDSSAKIVKFCCGYSHLRSLFFSPELALDFP